MTTQENISQSPADESFARLVQMLADAQRQEHDRLSDSLSEIDEGTPPMETEMPLPWWREPETASAVADQLRRCLEVLADGGDE